MVQDNETKQKLREKRILCPYKSYQIQLAAQFNGSELSLVLFTYNTHIWFLVFDVATFYFCI